MDNVNPMPSMSGTMSTVQSMSGTLSGHGSMSGSTRTSVIKVTNNYNDLINKPMIEGNVVEEDKTYEELGLNKITNSEMEDILL